MSLASVISTGAPWGSFILQNLWRGVERSRGYVIRPADTRRSPQGTRLLPRQQMRFQGDPGKNSPRQHDRLKRRRDLSTPRERVLGQNRMFSGAPVEMTG